MLPALTMAPLLGQNYEAFLKDQIDWGGVVATYIGLPVFLLIWWGYRMAKGSRTVAYGDMRFDGYVTIKK